MTLELIVNVLLLLFGIFCYFYVGATMPVSSDVELGAEQWPQGILILMFIAIGYNIYRMIKTNKANNVPFNFKALGAGTVTFFKSKLFIAMIIVILMAFLLEPLGFMTTCFLFMVSYGYLIGEKRPLMLIGISLLVTMILYIGFAVLLGVLLPRGNVPFLRNFALFIESVFPSLQ